MISDSFGRDDPDEDQPRHPLHCTRMLHERIDDDCDAEQERGDAKRDYVIGAVHAAAHVCGPTCPSTLKLFSR